MKTLLLSALVSAILVLASAQWHNDQRTGYDSDQSIYNRASSYDEKKNDGYYKKDSKVIVYQDGFKGGRYYYGGLFKDKCEDDGLYFLDDRRFVYCSNGNPYIQPCAPGTRNSGDGKYKPGFYYGYSDFCNTNLVDYGYGPEAYQPHAYDSNDGYKPDSHYSGAQGPYDRAAETRKIPEYRAPQPGSYGGDRYSAKTVVQERKYGTSDVRPYHSG
ncbi:hypothetical protein CAPTEDRAFT_221239, partial [Capitella teleta]